MQDGDTIAELATLTPAQLNIVVTEARVAAHSKYWNSFTVVSMAAYLLLQPDQGGQLDPAPMIAILFATFLVLGVVAWVLRHRR